MHRDVTCRQGLNLGAGLAGLSRLGSRDPAKELRKTHPFLRVAKATWLRPILVPVFGGGGERIKIVFWQNARCGHLLHGEDVVGSCWI